MNLSQAVRQLRKEKGMTQGQLGNLVGITSAAISTIERGTNSPSFATAKRLSVVLAFSLDSITLPDEQ